MCSLIDAKNDNVYFELFALNNNMPTSIISADCKNINELIDLLKGYDNICFVGDGAVAHQSLLKSALNNVSFAEKNQISSYSLGLAGLNAYNSGKRDDLLPLYLRKSQAERAKNGEK